MVEAGRKLPSIFYKHGGRTEYVRRGASFRRDVRRKGRRSRTETAVVQALYTDGGIPHVRFTVAFEKPFGTLVTEGPRILSAKEFFRQFPERVTRELLAPEVGRAGGRPAARGYGSAGSSAGDLRPEA